MEIEIPDGVAAVSLALVGGVRVLLRSDGRFHCTECDKHELADLVAADFGAAGDYVTICQHIRDVAMRGVVRLATDEDGRRYPEFVWLRGGGKTIARWPAKNDPDGARSVLLDVLRKTRLDVQTITGLRDEILANLRAKGYIVVPEWAGRSRERTWPTGRGARALDLEDV